MLTPPPLSGAVQSSPLLAARTYDELLNASAALDVYEYALMFSREGWLARRRSARRFALLRAIDPLVRRLLRPGERVFFATTGTTVTVAEHLFVGWAARYLNRRALVFTTERILLLQIDRKSRPHGIVSQIPIVAIASVKATWRGTCRVKLLNRRVFDFQSVPGADRKLVAKVLGDQTQGTNAPFEREAGEEHLCPHCYTVVPGHPAACPECHGGFKSANKAGVLSLIFPGLGDWYLGHRAFAALELVGSGFLWLVLVVLPLLNSTDPDGAATDGSYWLGVVIIIGLGHVMDAVMTRHFGLKGHHPAKAV